MIDGLSTVEAVADFLDAEVAGAVPGELRGEVRAAAKLLRACALELSVRPREVGTEIDDLLGLIHRTNLDEADLDLLNSLQARSLDPHLSLREQEDLRRAVAALTGRTLARLVQADDPRVAGFVECLGHHAARRSRWQDVFPANPAGVRQ
jgi:hypothetical protein